MFRQETAPIILQAVSQLSDFLRPTYGKNGRGVLIDKGMESSVLDDGFSIVEELEFRDPYENAVLKFIREATRKTNKRAGDGRTTTILLLHSLIMSLQAMKGEPVENEKKLKVALDKAVTALREKAVPVSSKKELQDIAMVSFNNIEMAKMVGEIVHTVGADGNVAVEESEYLTSSFEVKEGFFYEKGYVSPYMMTSPDTKAELKDVLVLVIDGIVSSYKVIEPILATIYQDGRSLLVVGDLDGEALQTLLLNKIQKKIKAVVTKAPPGQKFFLEDLALAVGAKVFSPSKGDKIADPNYCGEADKVVVTQTDTTIIGAKGDKKAIAEKVDILKSSIVESDAYLAAETKARIAQLTNGVGVLKVGAMSDGERRFIKAKAEDSVNATQLALKHGVVKGGGVALADVATTGFEPLDTALKIPLAILGESSKEIRESVEVNVVALESAVSIASTLYRSEGIITEQYE